MKIRAPNPTDLVGDSMVLKEQLATALEVDFPKLVDTLKAHKYILTFDVSELSWYCSVFLENVIASQLRFLVFIFVILAVLDEDAAHS